MPQRYVYSRDLPGPPLPGALNLPAAARIRPPTPADAEALADLMLESFRDTPDYHGETLDQARATSVSILTAWKGCRCWTARGCALSRNTGRCLPDRPVERAGHGAGVLPHDPDRMEGARFGRTLAARALAEPGRARRAPGRAVITEGNVPSEQIFAGSVLCGGPGVHRFHHATVCALLDIAPPALAGTRRSRGARRGPGPGPRSSRALPDRCARRAGGVALSQAQGNFAPVQEHAPVSLCCAVSIPQDAGVFCSMFTGALPEDHGIRRYERPVLHCDTLFDALIRAGKRVAMVAVKGSSMDLIFSRASDGLFLRALRRRGGSAGPGPARTDAYDVLVSTSRLRRRPAPDNSRVARALQAFRAHIATFARIAAAFDRCWGQFRRAILFTPDHGAHVDSASGKGRTETAFRRICGCGTFSG